ncbi:hypothetical protein [Edaphobacter bradus]|uniref:hypothetical protein n=1 Tax=Edaphobacter bradus TaxID=2259016 RepID=UPI0021DF6D6D|nr:hypothetical protein [Edaphobacter bradus]
MDNTKKAAIGGTLLLLAVVGVRIGMIYRERNAPAAPTAAPAPAKIAEDDLVFLKKKRPSTPADLKELVGTTLWVSAGGQMDYYPYAAHHADYGKSQGTLLGAEPLLVKQYFEQVAPKSSRSRIPSGDRQVLLAFTKPKSDDPAKEYAVPVGYHDANGYTFYTDEIFFYDDPHELYKHWGPDVWKAIDSHQVILGMSEREVQMALGQVSRSLSNDYGNRLVVYDNLGKPLAVTFVKNKVTSFRADSQ